MMQLKSNLQIAANNLQMEDTIAAKSKSSLELSEKSVCIQKPYQYRCSLQTYEHSKPQQC